MTALSWTLVYVVVSGSNLAPDIPAKVDGFSTEEACKDAAHKFMRHQDEYVSFGLRWPEGWFPLNGYKGIRCLEVK